MYVTCSEHLDQAIDEFIEIYQAPPDLYLLESTSFNDWTAPHFCDFCNKPPVYLVV